MNPIEFANYQRQLNAQRLNKINSMPKITSKVIISDNELTVSLPHLDTAKQDTCVSNQPTSNALF